MYAARKDRHPNVHLFSSGVDVEHFRRALDAATPVPGDIADLAHPVLLYYGVIDERMGWDNLEAVADAHPEWSIVLVGPLAKITEADLLRRPNIHYTGQRGYDDLPGYLKGCDLALVPFALSDATRYLSPTKTLEYFAARKPVVSTPIQDIVDNYADAARVAGTPEEFVVACEAALSENDTARLDRGEAHAAAQTWDSIVQRMCDLLDEAVARKTTA
jgi:UDP-galactopyranose mutase